MAVPKSRAVAAPPRRDTSTAPREVDDPSDPHEQRVAKLRERLIELLHDKPLARTRVGVEVMQASDGDILFAHNAQNAFNPASNTKMLTTAAAISYLGGDYRYHTALYGPAPDGEGVVHGDVVLRGSGDPSLTVSDLAEIAHDLASRGVTRIEGDLWADSKFHSEPEAEGVGDGAIILNRNTYAVRVRPGDVGHAALVDVQPHIDYFAIENSATTVKGKRSRLKIDAYRKGDKLVVTVKGRIAENRGDYIDARRLPDASVLAGWTLKSALNDFGVEMTGTVKVGSETKHEIQVLGDHQSSPLADVCKISNKPSNNFVAEAIYRTLGGELYGLPGNLAKGTRAVIDFLSAEGVKPGAYKIVNGSGLTHENRITPQDLAMLLRKLYFDIAVAPDFLSSLAIAGIDGTIRNRFMGTEAVGLVRAKTGTLSGVSALSGYVGDKDDVLVFTIFVEGFRHRNVNQVRHAQVQMVEAMLKFLHADKTPAGETNGEQPGNDTIDSESDGDPQPM